MKNLTKIFFLAVLFVLPSVVQSDYSAMNPDKFETALVAQEHTDSNLPEGGIYDPFLPFSAEENLSFSIKVPKPDVFEKLHDRFSREALNKTSFPTNITSFITASNQIDVGLSVKKLIFPFHSFL